MNAHLALLQNRATPPSETNKTEARATEAKEQINNMKNNTKKKKKKKRVNLRFPF